MRIRTLPLVLVASSAIVLTSCTGPAEAPPVPLPEPTEVTTDPATDPAAAPSAAETALVADYLDAVAAGDAATAWSMLTPEAQEAAAAFASYSASFGRQGTVSPEEAERLRGVEPVVAEGPEGAFTLVSAVDGDLADAWIVRGTDQGLRIDDAVVPSTGPTPYEWANPAAGPDDAAEPPPAVDTSRPLAVAFPAPEDGSEDGGLVGYPETGWAWIDGVEVPVDLAAAGSGRQLALDTSAWTDDDGTPDAVTVVWQVGGGSLAWRSTTVAV
ncbi:hypothetical protein FGG90_09505 [Clavibacter tessellarius]|uniref:Secreted protein n=1 Tax=Clavibacter tessellarius TaxID=31965 RepID=A0A225C8C9_9MICO|nr:hypothetical protein [Clavibacter michiganensis]OQJ62799.1 hypothetical protein B5P24_07220 [Clavibacter michiganensis subsp. tessellarius]UKF34215.1 hypothetical protein FGG90_09505 [Clavibacter michiganensis subsp. tessellarius]